MDLSKFWARRPLQPVTLFKETEKALASCSYICPIYSTKYKGRETSLCKQDTIKLFY